MKFRLNSLSCDTIKFLYLVKFHLNNYNKPDKDNLKSIIDLFVKILISAIDHDISQISQLKLCIQKVTPQLSTLKEYLEGIIREFSTPNKMEINATDTYAIFLRGRYGHLKTKLIEFSDLIKPLCKTLEQTIRYLNDTATIDEHDPKSFKKKLESNQDYLDPKYKSTLEELKKVPSLENIPYIQNVRTKLKSVQSEITKLISSISIKKDILDNFYEYYVEQLVPLRTPDEKVQTYYTSISSQNGHNEIIKKANDDKLSELKEKCDRDLESLKAFITNYTNHIQDFDTTLTKPCECIKKAIQKIDDTKSEINKQNVIQYIINLIDTVNFILSVEPSQIVEELKKIYPIKQELESIINSIKLRDIENDISNLENLYPNMLKINLFSTNIQKLKDHISSVECHLRGINSISSSLKNMQRILSNVNPLGIISYHLEISIALIKEYKSNLKEGDPVRKYMDQIKDYISELKRRIGVVSSYISSLISVVIQLKNEVEFTNIQIKCLKSDISELECAIEGVVRNLIRCSVVSLK